MNALVNATPNQTMTSKQIALVVDKRHDNVKRTIESLADQAVIVRPQIEDEQFKDSMGRNRTESVYVINERDSYVVVAQLCPAETAKLVDYWMATKNQAPREPNRIELAQWVIESETKLAQATEQLAIAAPKAVALDRIADTESLFTIREAAKAIKMKERDLVAELLRRGWAYRDGRNVMQPYAEKIAVGYVTSVMTKPITGTDGQDRVFTQLRITAKGVTRLSYLAAKGIAACLRNPDLEQSIAKTDELTAPMLDRSANRADLVLFFWVALILVIAVMWTFGQSSPVRMCGGV